MANRLSKITTQTGDQGSTGLADGSRRKKNDPLITCLGEVDELNAVIGLVICLIDETENYDVLHKVQHDLFDLGAELCQPGKQLLTAEYVNFLEQNLERMNRGLPTLKEFILPGGSALLAQIHVARTVCRRAERNLVALHEHEPVNPQSLKYLNRLSDLFFVLGRFIANLSGHKEVYWQSQFSRYKSS
jgi:cob(I)alamin adenosyltransferase